jgi:5-methylthioadenosine/S-adenosylhomocysteine deaminase
MTCSGRWGIVCAVVLTVSLLPLHAFAIDKLLIVNGTNLTMKPGQTEPFVGYILVGNDGKIKAIGKGNPPAGTTARSMYDARGKFVLPGFISAHSHLSESAFRGLATDQYVYEYPAMTGWVEALETRELGTRPEDYYWFTLQGALDHLVHGITSVYNFAYARDDNEAFEEYQWRAELDSGMRFIHSYEPSGKSTAKVRRANLEKFLTFAQKDMSRPTVLKMAYSGWVTTPEAMQLDASFFRDYHLYSEIHFLESPVNQEKQRDTFKYITAANILGPNVSFGHFIHPDDTILKTVAAAGSGMVWNPMSNGRLASGIADIPKYRKMAKAVQTCQTRSRTCAWACMSSAQDTRARRFCSRLTCCAFTPWEARRSSGWRTKWVASRWVSLETSSSSTPSWSSADRWSIPMLPWSWPAVR